MKRYKTLGIIILGLYILFLGGCEVGNNYGNANKGAKEIVGEFATLLNKSENDITQENIRRLNHEDIYAENEISGFTIQALGKKDSEIPNTDDFFDGWHREYVGDGMRSSLIEYRKGDIACYYFDSFEQEVPYEIINREGEYDSEEYNTLRNDFYKTVTYEVSLSCGETPEGAYNYDNMYFDVISSNKGFKWTASIRGSDLVIFTPSNIMLEYYFSDIKKYGNTTNFKGYQNEGSITEEQCIDAEGNEHKYSVDIVIMGDSIYEGCADIANKDFIIGEQGTIKTFNKKSKLNIQGGEKTYYEIMDIIGSYIQVSIGNYVGEEYIRSQLLIEQKDNGRNILYEGDYNISDDKCEELNQYDNNLMEMFFLQNCPRG